MFVTHCSCVHRLRVCNHGRRRTPTSGRCRPGSRCRNTCTGPRRSARPASSLKRGADEHASTNSDSGGATTLGGFRSSVFDGIFLTIFSQTPLSPLPICVCDNFLPLTLPDSNVCSLVCVQFALTLLTAWRLVRAVPAMSDSITIVAACNAQVGVTQKLVEPARGPGSRRGKPRGKRCAIYTDTPKQQTILETCKVKKGKRTTLSKQLLRRAAAVALWPLALHNFLRLTPERYREKVNKIARIHF